MHLKLDLNQDAELRNYIKTLIEQQVKSIVREEFKQMIEKEVYEKVESMSSFNNSQWIKMIQTSCDSYVNGIIRKKGLWDYGQFSDEVSEKIKSIISNKLDGKAFDNLVNKVASEKLKKLIEK